MYKMSYLLYMWISFCIPCFFNQFARGQSFVALCQYIKINTVLGKASFHLVFPVFKCQGWHLTHFIFQCGSVKMITETQLYLDLHSLCKHTMHVFASSLKGSLTTILREVHLAYCLVQEWPLFIAESCPITSRDRILSIYASCFTWT